MSSKIFVTGISTEVGKTLASAILVEALEADYWKPIQAGDLDNSDTHKVKALVTNKNSQFHKNSYAFNTPVSPHTAAKIDGISIVTEKIIPPVTKNTLVIEGAGGLLVPLNNQETILDIIKPSYKVIVVSRHYLGSINHTLLTINTLKSRDLSVALLFSGNKNPSTENIIETMTGVPIIGRIGEENTFTKSNVKRYAAKFKEKVEKTFSL